MGRHSKELAKALQGLDDALALQARAEGVIATWTQDERRPLFREFWERRQSFLDAGSWYVPKRPRFLKGLTCGARTQSGKPCRSTVLGPSGRCKYHGGASTGPQTPEGRKSALENLKLGRQKRGKS